jgi:hypothetical protein
MLLEVLGSAVTERTSQLWRESVGTYVRARSLRQRHYAVPLYRGGPAPRNGGLHGGAPPSAHLLGGAANGLPFASDVSRKLQQYDRAHN